MKCAPLFCADSDSVVDVSVRVIAPSVASHETSKLCMRSAGCSSRSTRANPHAPPFAALEHMHPKASTPLVSRRIRVGSMSPSIGGETDRASNGP